jgi:apolipoprotein N-acyltransferase
MLLLADAAAAPTALDKLKHVPPAFWLKLGLAVLALVAVVLLLRKVAQMNKLILALIVFLVVTFVGFNWVYQRNEPAWATPVVAKLAEFLPSKGAYKR